MTTYHLITRSRSCKYVEKHTKVGPRITEKRKGTTRIKCHLRFSQAKDRCTFFCSIFLIGTKQCSFSAAYLSIGYFQVNKLRHEASAESNLFTARELSPMTTKLQENGTARKQSGLPSFPFPNHIYLITALQRAHPQTPHMHHIQPSAVYPTIYRHFIGSTVCV